MTEPSRCKRESLNEGKSFIVVKHRAQICQSEQRRPKVNHEVSVDTGWVVVAVVSRTPSR